MLKTKLTDKQIQLLEHIIGIAVILAIAVRYYFAYPYNLDTKDYYQWARCINLGMLPYKDFNMLQTPMSAYINALFYKLGDNIFFLYVVPNTIVNFAIIFFSIKIARLRKSDTKPFFIYLWGISSMIICNALYNTLGLMLWIINLYIYFDNKKERKLYKPTLIGFLTGLCFYAKQNIAAYMVAAFGVVFIINWVEEKAKKETIAKEAMALWSSFLATVGTGLLIFWYQGNLKEFFEYILFGTSGFTSSYTSDGLIFKTIGCIVFCLIVVLFVWRITKESEICIMCSISLFVAFPIFNTTHLSLSFLFLFIVMSANIDAIKPFFYFLVWEITSIQSIRFFGCPYFARIEDYALDWNKEIIEYLDCKDVSKYHIIDALAGYYSVYYDRYDKYYDLFLEGNFGSKTSIDVIQETITAEKESYFIVRTTEYDEETNFTSLSQHISGAYDYIREHCIYVENIDENYAVYRIP